MPRCGMVETVLVVAWSTCLQCLGFHCKIDLRIAIGGLQGDVAQPRPDGVDVDPGTQQMDRGGVTNGMGTHLFAPERRGRPRGFCNRTLYQGVHTETRHPLTTDVEEHREVLGAFQSRTEQMAQDVDRMGPQRAQPDLASFPEEPYRGRRGVEMQGSHVGLNRFGDASPRIVEEQQQGVVALALEGTAIRGGQHGIDFVLLQVRDRWLRRPA